MISTDRTRVKLKDIVSSQIPSFVRDSYPLLGEFFKEYYTSQEYTGSTLDLLQNIDQYFNLDSLLNHSKTCILNGDLDAYTTTIPVVYNPSENILGTDGFPERYGLIKINNEIILYKSKTTLSFTECVRGFSGISEYARGDNPEELVFSNTEQSSHEDQDEVQNLSVLFLEKFLTKLKNLFLPGFEGRDLSDQINQKTIISRISDFYDSKGTEESVQMLFGILYGEKVGVVNPKDFLFTPSAALFTKTKDLIVEALEGNPVDLKNKTLRQDSIPEYGCSRAEAAVTNVEVIKLDSKTFYRLKLDYDYDNPNVDSGGAYGSFKSHPSTKLVNEISVGATVFDVDSTVGFPTSGKIVVSLPFEESETLTYSSKSLTQFFGVDPISSNVSAGSTVRLNIVAYGYTGISTSETIVRVKIGSVFNNVKILDNTRYFSQNEKARLTYPGIKGSTSKENDWILNVKLRYNVSNITLLDISTLKYRIVTYDDTIFGIGDLVTLFDTRFNVISGEVVSVESKKSFFIIVSSPLTLSATYSIQRNIRKSTVNSFLPKYSYLNNYNSDIQNVYPCFLKSVVVASPSIPSYNNQPLSFYDKVITLNGSYSDTTLTVSNLPGNIIDHGYYTGDSVFYRSSKFATNTGTGATIFVENKFTNFSEGVYFVKRENATQIKLSRSKSDIKAGNFLNLSGIVTSNYIEPLEYQNYQLKPQNLLRLFEEPNNESGVYITPAGESIGMFVNGVELTNYKSTDFIRYGEIESAIISRSGTNYDVINPPILRITDEVGVGATGSVSVTGSLQRIEVIDEGFDYVSDPIVNITGGNGIGANAKVNTSLIVHSVPFYSDGTSEQVNPTNNTIGFSTFHKFRTIEKIVYKSNGQKGVPGLSTDSTYYIRVIDGITIKFFNTFGDAEAGINTISLGGYGNGIHKIESITPKKIVTSILVTDSGSNYQNNEKTCDTVGINTALNIVNIHNHGYNSREVITYSTSGSSINGLSTSLKYIVTKVDNDNFKVSTVGIASTNKYFYYDTNQYVDLLSTGTGVHTFNYEPISVTISGQIGVNTFSGQDFTSKLQPIFRGGLSSVNIKSGGINYGFPEILNYERLPTFELESGKDAELYPVINNGSIIEVLVNYGGIGYNSPPDLIISGAGTNAVLTPIISNGRILSVKVINGGTGYVANRTEITLVSAGVDANILFNIKQWNVNVVQKNINILGGDDGILKKSLGERYGLQYVHAFTPRKLRESVYQKGQNNEVKYGVYDLAIVNGQESSSRFHSPIIGWAYDGNPIYGPYGFTSKTGGSTRIMRSGYELISSSNRPQFDLGFFVEDYEFKGNGDLDEHNGRYCVTPEYPNGTYAYFTTIDPDAIESFSVFSGYRKPVFPYVIGSTFKSKPIEYNFNPDSNQDSSYLTTDTEDGPWLRNTFAYNLQSPNTFYDYFYSSSLNDLAHTATIKAAAKGSVDSIDIIDSGSDYKVNDKINFDISDTGGNGTSAFVSEIKGKTITSVSVASTEISNVEVSPFNSDGGYIAFAENPHDLLSDNIVSIAGFNTSTSALTGVYQIGVSSERYSLTTGIGTTGTTGIVTYISLSGNLSNSKLRENDILGVGTEKVKVLNVDFASSRVKVLRAVAGTSATSHGTASTVIELSRKFTFVATPQTKVSFERNREIYFDPRESIGLGTVSGVGIGSTIRFSNPGVGITQILIPTKSIYLEQHGLVTGDPLVYSNNDGSSIVVSNGSSTFSLSNSSTVYAAKVSENLLGISTVQIGIGTTGVFVGIGTTNSNQGTLFFVGFGIGSYHSFKTNKLNSVKSLVSKNTVTVSVSTNHNLTQGDLVKVVSEPTAATTLVVKYDDYNRRMIINPRSFISSDVDIDLNTIAVSNHKLKNGDSIIHTSSSPCGGLEDKKIYYVIYHTKDKIKLSTTKYGAEIFDKEVVNITSTSLGTLSPINPPIETNTNRIVFDLSDESLSSLTGVSSYSAFDFKLYTDEDFTQEFNGTLSANTFNVTYVGKIGISSNASLILSVDNSVPRKLFYKLSPLKTSFVTPVKSQIIIDTDVINNNILKISSSKYSGSFSVASGVGTTTFNYYIGETPEASSYTSTQASLTYKTSSTTASGGICNTKITSSGYGYATLPGISSVTSQSGYNAILKPVSSGIGSILSITSDMLGYDYPTDKTLRPTCNLTEIFEVTPYYKLDSIGVTSAGTGYSLSPQLVLIDEYRNVIVNEVDLKYTVGKTNVEILKNTNGISGRPKIIPVNNSNGFKIGSITFNNATKDVSVGLNTGFSDVFPLSVGDKVLIENVSVGVGSTGTGYNSSNYKYKFFTLTAVPSGVSGLGGNVGIVTFNMADFLESDETPGTFSSINSSARIIPEKYFPVFNISIKRNEFAIGEIITSGDKVGTIASWNPKVDILSVSSGKEFVTGDIIRGSGTKTLGVVGKKYDFNAYVDTNVTSEIVNGWQDEVGFLNNNSYRVQDGFYYQNYSYTLKSRVPLNDWENAISSLVHCSGFARFSDLQVESNSLTNVPLRTSNDGSNVDVIADFVGEIDLSCYPDYDSVTENNLVGSDVNLSSEIYFSNRVLTDYFESVGNRALTIDDFSHQFNSEPRSTPYSIINEFDISQNVKKYFTYIRDKRFTGERQAMFVVVAHNGSTAYLNQYGRVETIYDLGSFDVTLSTSSGYLLFYPTLYTVNDFDVSCISFDLDATVAGVGSTSLGDTVQIKTQKTTIAPSSTSNIVSIATSYRASKVLVEIDSVDNTTVKEANELNIIHDGTNVQLSEYGQLTTVGINAFASPGLGTYSAYISGGTVKIDFTVNSGVGTVNVNTLQVSIANTTSSGIGTITFGLDDQNIAFIDSTITGIASSPSPTENTIARFGNDSSTSTAEESQHDASYFIICAEDKTNNKYQMSEVIVVDDENEVYITEYGNVNTLSGFGTVGAGAGTTFTNLYFTPDPNIDVEVRVFQVSLQLANPSTPTQSMSLNMNNGEINVGFGNYFGTDSDIKRDFNLTHGGVGIFRRTFFGNQSSVVDTSDDTILVPGHFFVTGEELIYNHAGTGTTQAIGIATTSFVSVGSTNKLPAQVFAVKIDDLRVKLSTTAENALKLLPVTLDIVSVGIGTSHSLTSKNQNGKCLIAVDNFIQSPVVSTSVTTGLSTNMTAVTNIVRLSGITSFFGTDLIKIDDEIMKIESVGFGSTNQLLVRRPWMGTGLSTHANGALVTKINGNYNIVQNVLNFVDAPKGFIPIGSITNSPDERDWTGISTRSKFQGRVFIRNAAKNTTEEVYEKNYIFDDISDQFNAVKKNFILKSSGQNVTGFSTNNAIVLINGIFQGPQGTLIPPQDYQLTENSGITSISFLGAATSVASDPSRATIPIGGIIISVGSTGGMGYQPLVAAGGTANISSAGTVSSISIGNSGSGYRVGVQTVVNVGVYTSSQSVFFIGTAAVSNGNIVSIAITNPGTGYTSTNPPNVVFDSPLSYSNIPLIYSSSGVSGIGTEATVDIVVGQGSSVIDFEISNLGYGYASGQTLTVSIGGTSGIPTDISKPFSEFKITVDKILSNQFSGWHIGQLEIFDEIDDQFDGIKKRFALKKNGSPVTIRSKQGSNIDVQATLIIFVNNILQVPGDGYIFTGGSVITFAEPLKGNVNEIPGTGDKVQIFFYKGSGDIDVQFVDVIETVKIGDTLTINDSEVLCQSSVQQDERLVTEIISSDTVETTPYIGAGINGDPRCIRPVTWCHQRSDLLVNGIIVGKSRDLYEPLVSPTSYIIKSVGSASTVIYVDSVRPIYNSLGENATSFIQNKIDLTSQDLVVGASATAVVSIAGTVSSISITDGGFGYVSAPTVIIASPVGLGTTQKATAIATISGGSVNSITVSYGGTATGSAYTSTNPPIVLIEPPSLTKETISINSYSGDSGIVVGFGTTTISGQDKFIFDLFIPTNSYLRNTTVVSAATTISSLSAGDYFIIYNSNVGVASTSITSIDNSSNIVAIGKSFVDNVYYVSSSEIVQRTVAAPGLGGTTGIGVTYVLRVFAPIVGVSTVTFDSNNLTMDSTSFTMDLTSTLSYTGTISTSTSISFGEFSWGKMVLTARSSPNQFNFYGNNGIVGITSSSVVVRTNPLTYKNNL